MKNVLSILFLFLIFAGFAFGADASLVVQCFDPKTKNTYIDYNVEGKVIIDIVDKVFAQAVVVDDKVANKMIQKEIDFKDGKINEENILILRSESLKKCVYIDFTRGVMFDGSNEIKVVLQSMNGLREKLVKAGKNAGKGHVLPNLSNGKMPF